MILVLKRTVVDATRCQHVERCYYSSPDPHIRGLSSFQLVLFAVVWPPWKLFSVDDENVQLPPRFGHRSFGSVMCRECPRKGYLRSNSCWLHPRESDPEVVQGPGGVTTPPTSLWARLGVESAA